MSSPELNEYEALGIYQDDGESDSEHTEPKHTEPEHTEPEHAKPEHTEPEHTEPKHTEPEHTEPKHAEPKLTEPKHTEPAHAESEHAEPKQAGPKHKEPEHNEAENAEPECAELEYVKPEKSEPDIQTRKQAEPDYAEPNEVESKLIKSNQRELEEKEVNDCEQEQVEMEHLPANHRQVDNVELKHSEPDNQQLAQLHIKPEPDLVSEPEPEIESKSEQRKVEINSEAETVENQPSSEVKEPGTKKLSQTPLEEERSAQQGLEYPNRNAETATEPDRFTPDTSRAFSADPALGIRGLSSQRRSEKSATHSHSGISRVTNDMEPISPSRQNSGISVVADGYLPTGMREVEYIQRKCIRTDTRHTTPVYKPRETHLSVVSGKKSRFTHVYLHQNRPTPMTPLKAWKGYSGNIYFSPIHIERVSSASAAIETVSTSQHSATSRNNTNNLRRTQTAKPDMSRLYHCDVPPKPAIKMDKDVVMDRTNKDIQEDAAWIRNTENLGSLKIERGAGNRAKENRASVKSLKKGSVAHQLALKKRENEMKSHILVANGKQNLSKYINPLLKATTQYSHSASRPTTNSPDVMHHGNYDKLPPLEQLRASLRGVTNKTGSQKPAVNRTAKTTDLDSIPNYVKLDRKVARQLQELNASSIAASAATP